MRLLHTADWHLGKTLKGAPLIDDQKFIINQIFDIIDREKIDALLIAGDVYDRAVPPVDAVDLFNDTLNRLAEKNLPTLIIAGNHDSAERLNFGSKLFESRNIHIAAKSDEPAQIPLTDKFGDVYFTLIPYFEPIEIRNKFFGENSDRMTFNAANKFYIDEARKKIPAGKRSVAVAHVFIEGGIESDSERKLVGTAGKVNAEIFAGYDYAALGHLHKPHVPDGAPENVRYAGSPLKYSAKEFNHAKGVTIVELDASGFVDAENIPLKPKHDLISVEGTLAEFQAQPPCDAYAYVTLTDELFVYDAAQKLREVFPHLMEVKNKARPSYLTLEPTRQFREGATIFEQFADFFEATAHRPLTADEFAAMKEICGG